MRVHRFRGSDFRKRTGACKSEAHLWKTRNFAKFQPFLFVFLLIRISIKKAKYSEQIFLFDKKQNRRHSSVMSRFSDTAKRKKMPIDKAFLSRDSYHFKTIESAPIRFASAPKSYPSSTQ